MSDDEVRRLPTDARLAELEAVIAQLRAEVLDLSAALAHGGAVNDPQKAVPPVYGSLDAWVEEYFCVVFARPIGGEIRWCPQWRDHPEAVTRLEALWRSWEALRLDPNLGIATWLTNFLDPQLGQLLSRSGTFGQCSDARHSQATPLSRPRLGREPTTMNR